MPYHCHTARWLGLVLLIVGSVLPSRSESIQWKEEPGYRWSPLPVPTQGKTGFTLLAPDDTGLLFTNTLDEGEEAMNRVLENGSGVAVGDFDNDGLPDIFLCGLNGRNALYRNLGHWKFQDVTADSGIICTNPHCRGAVFADINGDGNLDLLITTTGNGVLCFLNDGHGKFRDFTKEAGLESTHGSVTLALADVDGNGTLDLYVANNRSSDIRDRGQVHLKMVNGKLTIPPEFKDRLVVINGTLWEYGEQDDLYLNDGSGHFTPVSWTDGSFLDEEGRKLNHAPLDWGLTATFRDLNGDGWPDLYVCNDYWTPDRIWINDGHGHFRAIPRVALRNTSASSMGVDFADINRDGLVDFFVIDMLSRQPGLRKRQMFAQTPTASPIGEIENRPQFMRNTLQLNRGDGTFAEVANYFGVPASEWSWQPLFLDVDLDGYEDLIITAGHIRDVQDLDANAAIAKRQHSYAGYTDDVERQKAFSHDRLLSTRLYPTLNMPIITYRNVNGARFDETTGAWGTGQAGIHHAIATADFDGDGDLDLVVNNLSGACALYRNDSVAPRVAVRLKGRAPNTQAIGARIKLLGGAVSMQSQEVISGGRYMAGSDPLLVFAAGGTRSGMSIEVDWRSGRRTIVPEVGPNRLYEITEPLDPSGTSNSTASPPATQEKPLFEDVSSSLKHSHHEDLFNDFELQPLLPKKLSQLGPGVAWADLDGDGWEDLVVGSGKGGMMAIFKSGQNGQFQRISPPELSSPVARDQTAVLSWPRSTGPGRLLVGAASYEDDPATGSPVQQLDWLNHTKTEALPPLPASVGPLALADLRGDDHLELFVGGRVIPGRYPEAAPSRLYRQEGESWKPDEANTSVVAKAGLVSAAVWSDLDGDGFPELILACEWGPVRVYKNDAGSLHEITATLGLDKFTGWWAGVTTADLDGDGNMDIIAGNWGLNSSYQASSENPLLLYYGDFSQRGLVDLVEAEYDPNQKLTFPRRNRESLSQSLPDVLQRFHTHLAYSRATIEEILGSDFTRAQTVSATTLASMAFLNRNHHFEAVVLPPEAQWAPAFSVNAADFDGDGNEDIFLSQNFFATAPEIPRLDAGRGLLLRGDGHGGLKAIPGQVSGIKIYGEQRGAAVADYDHDGRVDLVVTQNGAATTLWHNIGAKPGIRVRLKGPPGNPDGLGAILRLDFGGRLGPAREIHGGSGYWSEDSPVQVLATPATPRQLWVRWPGGRTTTQPIPPGASEIVAQAPARGAPADETRSLQSGAKRAIRHIDS